MSPLRLLTVAVPVALALRLAGAESAAPARLEHGTLDAGAVYAVAAPEKWNGRLLLLAHGLREAAEPLHAHLFPERGLTRALLADGWIVALTSYRRNGVIVRDAIADLENLRAHVARTHGRPQRTYLMGDSMGGLIVTRIAERHPEHYDGAVGVGSALHMSETGSSMLNRQPQRPLLYLSNQSELAGPHRYAAAAKAAPFAPVLWIVARDGHVNVNSGERLAALAALVRWVEHGERPRDRHNATLLPAPGPSRARFAPDGSATGTITFVHPVHRSFLLDLQPADFAQLGLKSGDRFTLHLGGRSHELRYTEDPEHAGGGSVAGPEPEGFTAAILRGHAARESNPAVGDPVRIEPRKRR